MSFAVRGITHCGKCGIILADNEFGFCTNCWDKMKKEKVNDITFITLQYPDGNRIQFNGYWKDNVFHIVE